MRLNKKSDPATPELTRINGETMWDSIDKLVLSTREPRAENEFTLKEFSTRYKLSKYAARRLLKKWRGQGVIAMRKSGIQTYYRRVDKSE